jgi:hypothetical protein
VGHLSAALFSAGFVRELTYFGLERIWVCFKPPGLIGSINCDDDAATELCATADIQEIPTLILYESGLWKEYDGERTFEEMDAFLKDAVRTCLL